MPQPILIRTASGASYENHHGGNLVETVQIYASTATLHFLISLTFPRNVVYARVDPPRKPYPMPSIRTQFPPSATCEPMPL